MLFLSDCPQSQVLYFHTCSPVLPVQLALLCRSPLSTTTSTSYCLPGMRPTSWMRCSVASFSSVVLSTRAEWFQRSRRYLSQSPAGGSQLTRRDLSQPPPPALSSETFWGSEIREIGRVILKWGISGKTYLDTGKTCLTA